MLGKISGRERVTVIVKWRILRKEELYGLHSTPTERKDMGEARANYGGEKYIQGTGGET